MSESRRFYRIQNLNINEVNWVLGQLSDRLDEMQGVRGTPTFYDTSTWQEAEIKYVDENGTTLHSLGGV